MTKMIAGAVAILTVTLAGATVAYAVDKEKAREEYREATHHYDFGEYQQALDGFKAAYQDYEDPAFLFNVAQCLRALGQKQEAITFYKSYLRNTPAAPNRDDVHKIVAELQAAIDSEKPTGTDAIRSPAPATSSVSPPAPITAIATITHADKPTRSRKWIWGVAAGAVVVVGVAVGLAVGLGTRRDTPTATDGTVSF